MSEPKRILITGSNGLLGQKLVHAMRARDDVECIATSLEEENWMKVQDGYIYEPLDITNKEQVSEAMEKHRPHCVINTAAMTDVDGCEAERELCWQINVDAVGNLAEACERYNVHLIHLSTDFVFDGLNGPYKEDDQPNPLSYYAESKLASEQLLQKSQVAWTIVRTIIIYGVMDGFSRTNIVAWAKGALEKGDPINVVDDQFRAPTLAEDLAEACISAALKGATGIYHVGGKDIMSILELVYRVADFYGLDKSVITPVSSDTLDQAAKRPPHTGFILDKAIRELDYQPHSFEEGLEIVTRQLEARNSRN